MKKILMASIAGLALVGGYAAAQSMPMGNMEDHIKQMKEMTPEQMRAMHEQMHKMHAENCNMPMMHNMQNHTEPMSKQK